MSCSSRAQPCLRSLSCKHTTSPRYLHSSPRQNSVGTSSSECGVDPSRVGLRNTRASSGWTVGPPKTDNLNLNFCYSAPPACPIAYGHTSIGLHDKERSGLSHTTGYCPSGTRAVLYLIGPNAWYSKAGGTRCHILATHPPPLLLTPHFKCLKIEGVLQYKDPGSITKVQHNAFEAIPT